MNPSVQLVFDEMRRTFAEIHKKFDESAARWDRLFIESLTAPEQRASAMDLRVGNPERYPAAQFDASVVVDNWGGLFDGGIDSVEQHCEAQPMVTDNWGNLFEPDPVLEEHVYESADLFDSASPPPLQEQWDGVVVLYVGAL